MILPGMNWQRRLHVVLGRSDTTPSLRSGEPRLPPKERGFDALAIEKLTASVRATVPRLDADTAPPIANFLLDLMEAAFGEGREEGRQYAIRYLAVALAQVAARMRGDQSRADVAGRAARLIVRAFDLAPTDKSLSPRGSLAVAVTAVAPYLGRRTRPPRQRPYGGP